jgi:hypothetical protein
VISELNVTGDGKNNVSFYNDSAITEITVDGNV